MKYLKWLRSFPYNIISFITLSMVVYITCSTFFLSAFKTIGTAALNAASYLSDPFILLSTLIIFACCIVRLAGVKSIESLIQTVKDNARVLMSACLLIALGIIFLLLEQRIVEPQDVYLHFDPNDNMISGNFYIDVFSLADFYNLMGSSFILTGIFSILLGFTDFVNYVSNRLRSIVITDSYIEKLSKKEQQNLRTSLDKTMYGEIATGEGRSLYKYLKDDLEKLFYEPYRENLLDSYFYSKIHNSEDFNLLNRTNYNLVCTHATLGKKIKVTFNSNTTLTSSSLTPDLIILKALLIKIGSYTYSTQAITVQDVDDQNFELPLDQKCRWLPSSAEIKICLKRREEYTDYSISVSIPLTIDCNLQKKIPIEFQVDKITGIEDKNIILSMSYPTKGACLRCHIKQHTCSFKGQVYALNSENIREYHQSDDYEIKIDDWLFPGHGVVLTWHFLKERRYQAISI